MANEEELATEVSQLDALELENLQLKTEKAQAFFEHAVSVFNAKMIDLGKRYGFDPAKDAVHIDSRKIERK